MPAEDDHVEDLSEAADDRRGQPRLEPGYDIAPLIELPRGTVRAKVVDISPSGDVCLQFDESPGLVTGKKVSIWYGPNRETGIVRHVEKESAGYRVGIRLVDS